ncbi:MAG: HAD-IA family hydrolase [Ignavibacteriae bacterium]|nr:HAD-IA family hydrolase [Ignavibacteriota bacterium]
MKNRKYTTIVFDLGNVLIPFDHTIWVKKYNSIQSGLGDSYIKNYLEFYEVHRNYESGKLSDKEFISKNLSWLNNKVSSEEFREIFSNIFTLNENVIELLPKLKKKYKLVLLSNTNHIHKKYGWEKYSFLKNFDKLILSHEVGAVKPEAKIYKAVEAFTQEPPENHIFIDDILEYANSAKKIGWDAIQFIGYENLVEELKKRNIL